MGLGKTLFYHGNLCCFDMFSTVRQCPITSPPTRWTRPTTVPGQFFGHGNAWICHVSCVFAMLAVVQRWYRLFCVFPRSVDLWTPSSQAYTFCNASSDALGGLTIVATLAHELCWTCDYREDPCCCAADCRCQCPFNHWLFCAYRFDECLHAATSNTGSCIAKCYVCRACPEGMSRRL